MQLSKKLNLRNNLKIIQTTRNSKTNNLLYTICTMNNKGNKSNTRHRILDYIKNSDAVRSVDIDAHFDINRQMAHCHLKALIESSKIKKIGADSIQCTVYCYFYQDKT
jgi:predicted transcriptional regulator